MLLSSTTSPSSFMSSTVYSKMLTNSAMGCPGRLWSFLKKNSSTCLLLRGIHAHGSLQPRSFPHECLCLYPLSDDFGQARWSQRTFLQSLSDGIAVELRERSLRQASPNRDRARRHASSASTGACRRPRLGLDTICACLQSCSLCWLCWRCDQLLHASRRGGCEAFALSTRFQSAVSPERSGSPAGLSECGGL